MKLRKKSTFQRNNQNIPGTRLRNEYVNLKNKPQKKKKKWLKILIVLLVIFGIGVFAVNSAIEKAFPNSNPLKSVVKKNFQ